MVETGADTGPGLNNHIVIRTHKPGRPPKGAAGFV
jgi:hypothetical protein